MSYTHITINEHCCIVEYLNLGWILSKIAKELGRNKATISREIRRNKLNDWYSAHIAQEGYENRRIKCRPYGKIADATLVDYIQEKLNTHWSPEQISRRVEFDLSDKRISFSSIYNWIYKGLLGNGSVELLLKKDKSKSCLSTFV